MWVWGVWLLVCCCVCCCFGPHKHKHKHKLHATNTTQNKGAYVDADADPEAVAADLEGRMAALAALAGAAQAHDECLALLGQPAADPGPLLAAQQATAARHEVRAKRKGGCGSGAA